MTVASHSSAFPVSVSNLVPHRAPMLILEELQECTEAYARGTMAVQSGNPYLSAGGRLGAAAYPELAAQLFAASKGYLSRREAQSPRLGYLVGISDFQIAREAQTGERLLIEIETGQQIANVILIAGSVKSDNERLAEGHIKLYLAENIENPVRLIPIESSGGNVRNSIIESLRSIDISSGCPGASAEFCFRADDPVFRGHFPGYPVLPGVILIEAAQAVCEKASGRPLAVRMIEWAKYARPIRPEETVHMEIRSSEIAGAQLARFTVGGRSAASILLQMGEAS
jgi:3-hydroxymyristoyl/3-hydroxydecanoyl-(acyl carrier protein) dehydratase